MIDIALKNYIFEDPHTELIRHNENITYKVTDAMKTYVLRIHKPIEGFNIELLCADRDKKALRMGEMKLLRYLTEKGHLQTQKIKSNIHGSPVTFLNNDLLVTVLEWIEGTTLENIESTPEIAWQLGKMIGTLHNVLSHGFIKQRYYYDHALLSRMIDEASSAMRQRHFNKNHANTIKETLSCISDYLSRNKHRFIMVHSDLGESNLIYHGNAITPIDFSLSGYCIPEMDLASAFSHINDEMLRHELLSGYKSICELKIENYGIETCTCFQILLYTSCRSDL